MQQAMAYIMGEADGKAAIWLSPEMSFNGKPSQPELVYDGGPHAILYRSPNDSVVIDFIPEEKRARLAGSKSILVGEGRKAETEYEAKVVKVSKMPDMKLWPKV